MEPMFFVGFYVGIIVTFLICNVELKRQRAAQTATVPLPPDAIATNTTLVGGPCDGMTVSVYPQYMMVRVCMEPSKVVNVYRRRDGDRFVYEGAETKA